MLFSFRAASLPFIVLTLVNSPYKRGFYCDDNSIRYPYKPDTITHGAMAGVTIPCTVGIVSGGEGGIQGDTTKKALPPVLTKHPVVLIGGLS